jgi:cobalt/nickel transport protein
MSENTNTADAEVEGSRWRGGFAWGVGLTVALLLSGVVSFYASSSPDGLEWVAEHTGFINAAGEHAATIYSPLADYQVAGLSDPRLSGGLAGVIGTLVVLAVGMGLMWLLSRKPAKSA